MTNLDPILLATPAGGTITLVDGETYTTEGPWIVAGGINCKSFTTINAGTAIIQLKAPPAGITRPDKDLPILRAANGVTINGGRWDCNYLGIPTWFTQGLRFHGRFTIRGATIVGMSGSKTSGTPSGAVESFAISSEGDTGGSIVQGCVVKDCKVDSNNDYVSGIFLGATVHSEVVSNVTDCSVDLGVNGQFCYSSNQPTDFLRCIGQAARFWYNDTGPTRKCRIINCVGTGTYAAISCIAMPSATQREVEVIKGTFKGTRGVEWWDQSGGDITGGVTSTEVDYSACQYYLSSAADAGSLVFDRCKLGNATVSYASESSVKPVVIPITPPPTPSTPPSAARMPAITAYLPAAGAEQIIVFGPLRNTITISARVLTNSPLSPAQILWQAQLLVAAPFSFNLPIGDNADRPESYQLAVRSINGDGDLSRYVLVPPKFGEILHPRYEGQTLTPDSALEIWSVANQPSAVVDEITLVIGTYQRQPLEHILNNAGQTAGSNTIL